MNIRITGSHLVPFSGAAIVHREVAGRLESCFDRTVVVDDQLRAEGRLGRFLGHPGWDVADVAITTSTPLPVFTRAARILPIVYDVRWQWTRGAASRFYRSLDLRRTAARAGEIVTISHTVADQLRNMQLVPDDRVHVVDLGPGQFEGFAPTPVGTREPIVMLVGAAAHKRNELAARLLTQVPEFVEGYSCVGVSVSDETKAILSAAMPSDRLDFPSATSTDDLGSLYGRCRSYLSLGTSEGFGFPYIESAYFGCDVIAPAQPLTTELLGRDANHLPTDQISATDIGTALASHCGERVERLQARATARSWATTAEQLAGIVERMMAAADSAQ